MSTETKSLAAKITKGAWKAKRLRDNGGAPYATLYEAHMDLGVCMVWAPEGNEEQEANAELIAEAGTVTNETGMTPSELLAENARLRAERDELVGALESAQETLLNIGPGADIEADPEDTSPDDSIAHEAGLAYQMIADILSKHKPE